MDATVEVEDPIDPGCSQVAINPLRNWRFVPAMREGQLTAVKVRVPIQFE